MRGRGAGLRRRGVRVSRLARVSAHQAFAVARVGESFAQESRGLLKRSMQDDAYYRNLGADNGSTTKFKAWFDAGKSAALGI